MITEIATNKKTSKAHAYKKEDVLFDFKVANKVRLISKQLRGDVLNGRAKFTTGCAGKELLQIAMGNSMKKGDFYSGYYRDHGIMMKLGLATTENIFSSLYADSNNDIYSGGRNMPGHFSTPTVDENGEWLNLLENYNIGSAIAPLAGHLPRSLGLALASKYYRNSKLRDNRLTNNGNEVSYCMVGDATTSEGVFFETVNAACVQQVPLIIVIQDDGHGISVPIELQTTKQSISQALKGFQRSRKGEKAAEIFVVKAWDYNGLIEIFKKASKIARQDHTPCVIHVTECTQLNGHSTSGSHERYKSPDRLQWEKKMDCLIHFEDWILKNKLATAEELEKIKKENKLEVKEGRKLAWVKFQEPFLVMKQEVVELATALKTECANSSLDKLLDKLSIMNQGNMSDILQLVEDLFLDIMDKRFQSLSDLKEWYEKNKSKILIAYSTHLYCENNKAALKVPEVCASFDENSPEVNGYEVLNKYFDQLFKFNNRVIAFGEDLGKIGGVNQCFSGLQEKYGEQRVFDTGIREWTIVGQAIGMAMRGLRPIGEVQYLDYLIYALPALMDDLANMRWRTIGAQISPTIIRTRGHRLEGIWHSGSPIGMLVGSLRGIYLLTPRNMTQAAGMYNTMLKSNDAAIIIEVLNGYRNKEKVPLNLESFTVSLGVPEILIPGMDITIVTYGACVNVAIDAVEKLKSVNIKIELIDIQTLLPFDINNLILESIKKTNRVIFLDEDVPGGGTAYMMEQVINKQGAFVYLDSKPVCISAKEHRPPFGDNGNYACKPMAFDIIRIAMEMMNEANPKEYIKF